MRAAALLLFLLLLTGCVGPLAWSRPDVTYNDRLTAWDECDRSSTARLYQAGTVGFAGMGGIESGVAGVGNIAAVTIMERQRHTYFAKCMEAKGYTGATEHIDRRLAALIEEQKRVERAGWFS